MIESPLPKSKCFVYLRRSQDREDRQQLTIGKQDRRVKEIISENKFVPIDLPAEERSAKYPGRPIFGDMMKRIENGEARYIAVWQASRLSRNPIDAGTVIYAMDMGKLLAVYTPDRVYRNTASDKSSLAIELALAKKNNDDLSEQVKDSFVDKRTRGEYPGPAPIGYKNVIVRPGVRNIAPDDEDAKRVHDLFVYAATGSYTVDDCWRYTYKIGLRSRSGSMLAKQTVIEILKRRMYTGVFRYGSPDWFKGSKPYTPIILNDLYDSVQQTMGWAKAPSKNASTSGAFYAYKGIPLCGTCGMNITAYTKPKVLASGKAVGYSYYTCTKKSKVMVCPEPQLAEHELKDVIKEELSNYEISPADGEVCKSLIHNVYEDYKKNQSRYDEVWLNDLRESQKALDVLDDKLERGIITDERYIARSAKHTEIVARTTQQLANANQDAERWLELCNETFSGVTNIGDVFEMAEDEERREIMLYLGTNWTLSNKKVALTPREPLNMLHISNRKTSWRARPDSNRRSSP